MNTRPMFVAALSLAASLTALADIKINDNLMINGYVAGAYEYQKTESSPATDSLFDGTKDTPSADALKTAFNFTFKPVTGVVSLYYVPNLPKNELSVLDSYVTYDAGGGFSVTGGKFLSYLGYEAFDTVNMTQISYGLVTVGTLSAIPTYHTGVRLDYGDKDLSYGLAVVDSVFSPNGFAKGDGELRHNGGFEGNIKSTAITDLTLWAGFAYDTQGGFQPHAVTVFDVWAEYKLTKDATIAAEVCNKNGGDSLAVYKVGRGTPGKGYTWLTYLNYSFDPKWSAVFRITGESLSDNTKLYSGGFNTTQYTFCPSVKLSDNLTVRAEVTQYSRSGNGSHSSTLFGVQGVFKF